MLRSSTKANAKKALKFHSLMAFLVSFTFSLPFSVSNTFFKELHSKKTVLVRPLRHPDCITAAKLSTSSSITSAKPSTNQRYRNHLSRPLRQQQETIPYHMKVDSCSHMIISGFWVGPDVDDGWGYIEAFINPII